MRKEEGGTGLGLLRAKSHPDGRVIEPGRASATGGDSEDESDVSRSGKGRRWVAMMGASAIAAVVAAYYGQQWYVFGRFQVSTNDAYVRADITLLAPKVSGYVAAVFVKNNQRVNSGDLIVRIDDGDYRLAVQAARDKIAVQEATVSRIVDQKSAASAAVAQARAQIAAARADLTRTELELQRQNKLTLSGFASKAKLESALADRDRMEAAVNGGEAGLASAEANVAVLDGQRIEAERVLVGYQTELAKAERDLSFTEIRAPVSGVIGNRAVQVGQFVQPGARLAAIVPLEGVYIEANFKETQLSRLRPGQPVTIKVDAYPDRPFEGVVESLSPASGATFSLLPPENATGNFTKIIQRLTVRITVKSTDAHPGLLRPGMSVEGIVDTRDGAVASVPWASDHQGATKVGNRIDMFAHGKRPNEPQVESGNGWTRSQGATP